MIMPAVHLLNFHLPSLSCTSLGTSQTRASSSMVEMCTAL